MVYTILEDINEEKHFFLITIWHNILQQLGVCFAAIRSKQQRHWQQMAHSCKVTIMQLSKIQYQIFCVLTLNTFYCIANFIVGKQKDTLITITKLHISLIQIIGSNQLPVYGSLSNDRQIVWISKSVLNIPTNTVQNNVAAQIKQIQPIIIQFSFAHCTCWVQYSLRHYWQLKH